MLFANLISLPLLVVLFNVIESKPAGNCQKCLADSLNYIDHYKYLDCKAITNKDCPQCIDRFECPRLPLEGKVLDAKKCHVANTSYTIGESILFKRKFCKYCTCVDVPLPPSSNAAEGNTDENGEDDDDDGEEEATQPSFDIFNASSIMNRPPPSNYNPIPLDGNYEARVTCAVSTSPFTVIVNSPESNEYCFYKETDCSSTRHCISTEKLEKENCQYQGKKYAFGEIIYPEEEDRCLKCKCSANLNTNNINQMVKQCERLSCDLEDMSLNQGCLPIYENKCCPNNYYCPNQEEGTKQEPIKTGKCYFNGKNYDVGSKLNTDNNCLDCQCKIPPYFTCVTKDKCEE